MSSVWKSLQQEFHPEHTHADTQRVQAVPVRVLWEGFPPEGQLQEPPPNPQWREGLQVQRVQQGVPPGEPSQFLRPVD